MKEIFNILKDISSIDENNKNILLELNKLWDKLYKYEKINRNELRKKINEYSNESLRLIYKLEQLENKSFYYVDVDPIINNDYLFNLKKFKNKRLTDDEIKLILNTIVQDGRRFLVKKKNVDIKKDNLLNLCIVTSRYLSSKYCKHFSIYTLRTDNIYNSEFPHEFNVIEFLSIDGSIKRYIIDLTYRQFCLLSKCNKNRMYHVYGNYITPGFFFKNADLIKELLSKGYIEVNEKNSKIYADSFILASLTKKNIDLERFIIEDNVEYPEDEYIKTLVMGTKINRH